MHNEVWGCAEILPNIRLKVDFCKGCVVTIKRLQLFKITPVNDGWGWGGKKAEFEKTQ